MSAGLEQTRCSTVGKERTSGSKERLRWRMLEGCNTHSTADRVSAVKRRLTVQGQYMPVNPDIFEQTWGSGRRLYVRDSKARFAHNLLGAGLKVLTTGLLWLCPDPMLSKEKRV
jgi:hypothetical protein